MIDDAIQVLQAFDGMEAGFRDRAERVLELLAARETSFVLVASPCGDTVEEASYFADRLAEGGISVAALVVNRMHPRFGTGLAEATRERARTLAGTDLGELFANLADFELVAAREEDHLAGLAAVSSRRRWCACRSSRAMCTTSAVWMRSARISFGSLAPCP